MVSERRHPKSVNRNRLGPITLFTDYACLRKFCTKSSLEDLTIFAGTEQGLFWSRDGGDKMAAHAISPCDKIGDTLLGRSVGRDVAGSAQTYDYGSQN